MDVDNNGYPGMLFLFLFLAYVLRTEGDTSKNLNLINTIAGESADFKRILADEYLL